MINQVEFHPRLVQTEMLDTWPAALNGEWNRCRFVPHRQQRIPTRSSSQEWFKCGITTIKSHRKHPLQQSFKTQNQTRRCHVDRAVGRTQMCILLPLREPKEFCQKNGIVLQAYASLGSGDAKQAQLEGWRWRQLRSCSKPSTRNLPRRKHTVITNYLTLRHLKVFFSCKDIQLVWKRHVSHFHPRLDEEPVRLLALQTSSLRIHPPAGSCWISIFRSGWVRWGWISGHFPKRLRISSPSQQWRKQPQLIRSPVHRRGWNVKVHVFLWLFFSLCGPKGFGWSFISFVVSLWEVKSVF